MATHAASSSRTTVARGSSPIMLLPLVVLAGWPSWAALISVAVRFDQVPRAVARAGRRGSRAHPARFECRRSSSGCSPGVADRRSPSSASAGYRRVPAEEGQADRAGNCSPTAGSTTRAITAFMGGPGRKAFDDLAWVDKNVVDGAVNGAATECRSIGGAQLRKAQTGFVRNYALGIGVGVVALLGWFLIRDGNACDARRPPRRVAAPVLTALILLPAIGALVVAVLSNRRGTRVHQDRRPDSSPCHRRHDALAARPVPDR